MYLHDDYHHSAPQQEGHEQAHQKVNPEALLGIRLTAHSVRLVDEPCDEAIVSLRKESRPATVLG